MSIIKTIRQDWPEIKEAWRLTDKTPLWHAGWIILVIITVLLTSCTSTRPHPVDERPNAQQVTRAVALDTTAFRPALLPRLTDAIGLSTPTGRARRQARKDAAATVPRKLGKGAVYAPLATDVVNAYKPRQAVIRADSGAIVTAIGKNKAPAATAPHATATQAIEKPGFWSVVWATLLPNLWWLLVLVALYVFRKRLPVVGPLFS